MQPGWALQASACIPAKVGTSYPYPAACPVDTQAANRPLLSQRPPAPAAWWGTPAVCPCAKHRAQRRARGVAEPRWTHAASPRGDKISAPGLRCSPLPAIAGPWPCAAQSTTRTTWRCCWIRPWTRTSACSWRTGAPSSWRSSWCAAEAFVCGGRDCTTQPRSADVS